MFSKFLDNLQNTKTAYPEIKETLPPSTLGYNTNNKYPEFPPMMSDGRAVTASWQPESVVNAYLKDTHNINSNWKYRKYLTKNANSILDHNFKEACNDVGYFKRPIDITSIHSNKFKQTNEPHLYSSLDDETKPFGYTSSDLKSIYLTREELQSRKISPTITQDNLLKAQLRL
tara:strand:- start:628 stop:1146 length:519 start_codon:yes stop_codon:yes gene_type:complete